MYCHYIWLIGEMSLSLLGNHWVGVLIFLYLLLWWWYRSKAVERLLVTHFSHHQFRDTCWVYYLLVYRLWLVCTLNTWWRRTMTACTGRMFNYIRERLHINAYVGKMPPMIFLWPLTINANLVNSVALTYITLMKFSSFKLNYVFTVCQIPWFSLVVRMLYWII